MKLLKFPNHQMDYLKEFFLWVGCCTAQRGGSYYNIMTEHFKERDDGGF